MRRAVWLGLLLPLVVLAATPLASFGEKEKPVPKIYVAIYEISCGVTVPESRCAGGIVDSLLAWGLGVQLAPEIPVTTTVPPELRERIFGEDAATSAKLSATMTPAGGFSVKTETKVESWANLDLYKWPWALDNAAVMKAAKESGCTHVLHGTARAKHVATDLSDTGLDEVVSVRGSLSAQLNEVETGLLKANYREEASQISTSCTLGAGRCFAFLSAGASEKIGKALRK